MVTNFHVVAKASADKIFVTNKSIGTLKRATIVKMLGPMDTKGADFALLRVADVSQPAFAVRVDDKSLRLQSVIAAGYPGDLLRTDAAFKALQSGDLSAVPDLAVTEGSVVAEQDLSDTTHAVVHSAPISTGNSGGPLIDMCGRVVGVNTFVVKGPMRSLNFALASDDLMAFLGDAPVQPRVVSGACVPLVTRPLFAAEVRLSPEHCHAAFQPANETQRHATTAGSPGPVVAVIWWHCCFADTWQTA